jgi:hypothetical protein
MFKRIVLTQAMVLFIHACFCQEYSLNDFSERSIASFSATVQSVPAKFKTKNFSVLNLNDQLKITDFLNTEIKVYPLKSGTLLALDMGEWGGGLFYQPDTLSGKTIFLNGQPGLVNRKLDNLKWLLSKKSQQAEVINKSSYLTVIPLNVAFLQPYQGAWIGIQPFRSMTGWTNTLYKVSLRNDSITVAKISAFDHTAIALTSYKDAIYVATRQELYKLENGNKILLMGNVSWQQLNPNSIAVMDREHIYIGVLGGIVQFNELSKDVKFFIYNR